MFPSLRWRLTFWFVTLTTLVYTLATICAIWLFQAGLTQLIREEIEALDEELRPAVDLRGNDPTLREWSASYKRSPFKALPTILLFNADGKLVEEHGPPGVPKLFKRECEIQMDRQSFIVYPAPLTIGRRDVGYLQIELSLRHRDQTTTQFAMTMASVAPFLLLSLGIAGYFFSSKAAQPLEDSLLVLRRFMNDAGHELGTPITIIQANAEAMEVDIENNAAAETRLTVISRATERMGKLVQDLMLLSKMESPQLDTKKVTLDLEKLVRNILEEFDELFKTKGINLKYDRLQPVQIFGDAEGLKRLLTNLLQNAMRYTDAEGTVTVSLESSIRNVRLRVADTGIGIPAESLPRIFDRFYRVDKSRSRAAGGVGLGLSIVRAIVDAHKGRVEVHSQENQGTEFIITLPLRYMG